MIYNYKFNSIKTTIRYSKRISETNYLYFYIEFNSNTIEYDTPKNLNCSTRTSEITISDNLRIFKIPKKSIQISMSKYYSNNITYVYNYNKKNSLILNIYVINTYKTIYNYKNNKITNITTIYNFKLFLQKIIDFYYKNYLIYKYSNKINIIYKDLTIKKCKNYKLYKILI